MSDVVDQGIFREVSSNLKLLAKIKKGDKLNTKSLQISKPSLWRFILRFLSHETGSQTYNFIADLIDKISSLLKNPNISSDQKTILLRDIEHAKVGIDCIRQTYEPEDDHISAQILTLQEQLEIYLRQ